MVLAFAGDSTITSLRPLVRVVVATASSLARLSPLRAAAPATDRPGLPLGRVVTTVTPPDRPRPIWVEDRLTPVAAARPRRVPRRPAASGPAGPPPAPPAARRARRGSGPRRAHRRTRRPGRPARY